MERRFFIRTGIVGSIAGLAGCASDETDSSTGSSSSGSESGTGGQVVDNDLDDDGVVDSQDDFPNDAQWSEEDKSTGTISVNEDGWYQWGMSPSQDMGLSYDFLVRDGPPVDVILFSKDEFWQYENQNRARYHRRGSVLNTNSAQVDTTITGGDYVLVLDNTSWGQASPPTDFSDSVARVDYSITRKM